MSTSLRTLFRPVVVGSAVAVGLSLASLGQAVGGNGSDAYLFGAYAVVLFVGAAVAGRIALARVDGEPARLAIALALAIATVSGLRGWADWWVSYPLSALVFVGVNALAARHSTLA